MIEQITSDFYRIEVPMPNNPLKYLNSYFIRGDRSDLLIDTGFRMPECRAALAQGLRELAYDPDRLDVALTHLHSDHSGLAGEFAGKNRSVYISKTDLSYQARILAGEIYPEQHRRNAEEGYPESLIMEHEHSNPARLGTMQGLDSRFTGLEDQAVLRVGGYRLKMIATPGHTPGNAMFWAEAQETMFTGDNVLFDITPNITAFVDVEDPLGDYLDSLRKAKAYPVKTALPGHRKSGDYHRRIKELLIHHEHRLEETQKIVASSPGMSAYEIAGKMTWQVRARDWDSFPNNQKWFAVGECEAHLDHLRKQGRVGREKMHGIWRYSPR